MGWMGSSTTVVQQPSQSSIDPAQRAMLQNTYNQALEVEQRPYVPYTGQTVAGFDPTQTEGQDMILNGARSNVGGGYLDAAGRAVNAAQGWNPERVGSQGVSPIGQAWAQDVAPSGQAVAQQVTPGMFKDVNLTPYMNPYLQQVVDTTTSEMGRQRTIQQNADEDKYLAAGAYGGARHGVADSETNRNYFDMLGKTLGGLYQGGFDRASDLAVGDLNRKFQADTGNADRGLQANEFNIGTKLGADEFNSGQHLNASEFNIGTRLGADEFNSGQRLNADEFNSNMGYNKANLGLTAAQMLSGLSTQQRQQYFQNAGLVSQVGQDRQAQTQAQLDDAYARWKEGQMYPQQAVGWLANVVNGMPSMGGTTSGGGTTQKSNPSFLSQAGGALGLAGMIGSFFSDENVKSDVKSLDTEDGTLKGLKMTPVKTWRYDPTKGGPNDGGAAHIGPMAQDMKRNLGIGDGHQLPVVDVMGAHHAAINSLARKVDKLTAAVKPSTGGKGPTPAKPKIKTASSGSRSVTGVKPLVQRMKSGVL